MKRVTVIGAPGTGKSTFSLRLGEVTGLPVVHLDQHFWNPGWVGTPSDECRRNRHRHFPRPATPGLPVANCEKNAHDLRPRQAGLGTRMPGTIRSRLCGLYVALQTCATARGPRDPGRRTTPPTPRPPSANPWHRHGYRQGRRLRPRYRRARRRPPSPSSSPRWSTAGRRPPPHRPWRPTG